MAKKNRKTKPLKENDTKEAKGLLVFASALIILLSLISFAFHGSETHNWLGATGFAIGWGLTISLGLPSYLIALYLLWIGWRLIFKKTINQALFKTACVILGLTSVCILLSVLETSYPLTAKAINASIYQQATKARYHLGGAPFYYLYHDLPGLNLRYLLNSLGATIFFASTLAVSLLLLGKVNPFFWIQRLFFWLTSWLAPWIFSLRFPKFSLPFKKENPSETGLELKKTDLSDEQAPDSDFMRYVKLRIPGALFPSLPATPGQPQLSQAQGEMLAIQPELNLKLRPSISRKEQAETPLLPKRKILEAPQEPLPKDPLSVKPKTKDDKPQDRQKQKREKALSEQRVHNGDFSDYKLPTLNLLTAAKRLDHSSLKKDLKHKAEVLEETLLSFGIEAKVGQINCGPTITSFEVHPAIGVKVQKIKTLDNDIALNMEAKSIRIIAPIPGKAAVGIEVPNAEAEEVGFKEMMAAYTQGFTKGEKKLRIPILLGKAVNGDYVMSDLAKMPHCIIAGATGSGKSVCINTIVMSIVMSAKPDEIKLLMVDPKKVELTPYSCLPHMLAPVITEPQGASSAMNWLVKEMEKRYDLLKQVGVRNIDAFNLRNIDNEFEASLGIEVPEKLPYIVGIIDELADLMMVSSSDIETPIARIAQMARAVGIHLILATQRPSREVITGIIKANFPTRISFKVSSRINSQIVLDDIGAESLLGNGDMLFLPPGSSHLVRAQGAFIRDEDISSVIKAICDQAPPRYVIESFDSFNPIDANKIESEDTSGDTLYLEAVDIVLGTGNASTTFLQRKLKIGYARAASLIDMLEQKGIVGPAEGSKPRKILASRQMAKEDSAADEL